MKEFLVLFCFIFLFTFPTCLTGQDNYVLQTHSLSVPDGLLSPATTYIFEDSRGIIWIGTDCGLNSYDGVNLTSYTKRDGLTENYIYQINEDMYGNIWVICATHFSGHQSISVINIQEQAIYKIEDYCSIPKDFDNSHFFYLNRNYDGSLSMTTSKADLYEYNGEAIVPFPQIGNKEINSIWGKLSNEELFFIRETPSNSPRTVQFYNYKTRKKLDASTIYNGDSPHTGLYNNVNISVDPEIAVYWISVNKDKSRLEFYGRAPKDSTRLMNQLNIDFNTKKVLKTRSHLFIENENNIACFNHKGTFLKNIPLNKHFLSYTSHLVDTKMGLWYKDSENEVLRYSRYQASKFKSYNLADENSFRGGRCIYLMNDSLLLMGSVLRFKDRKLSDSLTLKNFKSYSIFEDKKGLFYSGENSCTVYDQNLNKISSFIDLGTPKIQLIWDFMQDQNGKIWVGNNRGLAHLDQTKQQLTSETQFNDFDLLKTSIVYHIHEHKNKLYLCSSTGLYLWDKDKGAEANYLSDQIILHLHEDKEGIFWLASKGGGLIKFDPKTEKHQNFTTADGLSNNIIYSVYEDDYNKLWMSSNWGIMSFDKKSHFVANYVKENGLLNNEFNTISHYQDYKGNIYFGNQKGLIFFHPKDFKQNQISDSFPILVTKLNKVIKETGEEQSVKDKHRIDLYPSDKGFVLNVALLDYRNPKAHQYAYKIEGIDNKWHYQLDPNISEKNLPYGNYTIRVKIKGVEGIWIEYPTPIQLFVYKPFYLQWWFLVLSIGLSIGLVLLLIKVRTRNLLIQQKELEETVRVRTKKIAQQADDLQKLDRIKSRFFANISHELRTPLTLIIGPITLLLNQLKKEREDVPSIEKSLKGIKKSSESLLDLVEEILDLSKMEVQKLGLNEEDVHLASFVRKIYDSFSKQADFIKINYTLELNVEESLYLLLDENKVERMLNNLLSNAFKFTEEGENLTFTVNQTENEIEFIVADTGIGIHPDDLPHVFERFYQSKQANVSTQGGTGIGLALVTEYTALMNGSVHADSVLEKGSTFSICLPKQVTALSRDKQHQILAKYQQTSTEEETEECNLEFVSKPQKSITILIVEDHPEIRNFIYSILELDYHVLTASNGLEGLTMLQNNSHKIDLIISDVMMPKMDGFELLEAIKADKNWQHTPMIMLTARASEEDKLHALTIGVHDYLTKPFSVEELKVRIHNLLHNVNYRKTDPKEQQEALEPENTPDDKESTDNSEYLEVNTEWVKKIENFLILQVSNEAFTIALLAEYMHLSEGHLRRKLKQITGLTPAKMFKLVRLNIARSYLEKRTFSTVKEVAFAVGFQTTDNFSKSYKKQFGKLPSDY
jgi:signal transduction histidine kinase/CheY-like chemotaxis protein/AraC-like DNA-binding protein